MVLGEPYRAVAQSVGKLNLLDAFLIDSPDRLRTRIRSFQLIKNAQLQIDSPLLFQPRRRKLCGPCGAALTQQPGRMGSALETIAVVNHFFTKFRKCHARQASDERWFRYCLSVTVRAVRPFLDGRNGLSARLIFPA